ncbi:HlyD family secretion protein [Pedobacter sp. PWIIR3]
MPSLYSKDTDYTEEVQDIITAPPSWLLRWGISIFFVVLLFIIIISSVVRYPDLIKTTLTIKSESPPVTINSLGSGKISKVYVKDNQFVKEREILIAFESIADKKLILSLDDNLSQQRLDVMKGGKVNLKMLNTLGEDDFGELDNDYRGFLVSTLNYSLSRKEAASGNLIHDWNRHRFLHYLDQFMNKIRRWESQYLIRAQMDGNLSLLTNLKEGQFVDSGQPLFFIAPENSSFYGVVSISQQNIGKIRVGQQVHIKVRSYPFEEFGILTGKIQSINGFIVKDSYSAVVAISDGKNISRKMLLKNNMLADAEIITEDLSVFKRITRSLIKILK